MGVLIFTEPAKVHWPNGLVSKLSGPAGLKKGKKSQKTKHGIFWELVSNLAPSIPPSSGDATNKVGKKGSKPPAKGFKTPIKSKLSSTVSKNLEEISEAGKGAVGGAGDSAVDALHQGLPAQGRRSV